VLDTPPNKISKEKKVDVSVVQSLNYDNTPPVHADGSSVEYDNSAHDYNSTKEKQRAQNRKKNRT
jgi:hypothetical protein